jgi:Flp pilus assembly protein TadG
LDTTGAGRNFANRTEGTVVGQRVSHGTRRGSATVELAVAIPAFLMIVFGAIEASNAISLKQVVTQAAYEAAREATASYGTEAEARRRAEEVLAARRIKNCTISFSEPIDMQLDPGTEVETLVSAPVAGNAVMPSWFFGKLTVTVRVWMTRI